MHWYFLKKFVKFPVSTFLSLLVYCLRSVNSSAKFCRMGRPVHASRLLLAPETISELLNCSWDSAISVFLRQASMNIAAFYQVEKNSGSKFSCN